MEQEENSFIEQVRRSTGSLSSEEALEAFSSLYFEIYKLDFTDGIAHCLYLSDKAYPLFSGDPIDLRKGFEMRLEKVIHGADREDYAAAFAPENTLKLFEDPSVHSRFISVRMKGADGEYYWSNTGLIRLDEPGKDAFLACTRNLSGDMTLYRGVPTFMNDDRNTHLQRTLDGIPSGVAAFTIGKTIRFRYANERAYRVFGLVRGQYRELQRALETLLDDAHQMDFRSLDTHDKDITCLVPARTTVGKHIWARATFHMKEWDGEHWCYCMVSDVSRRMDERTEINRLRDLYSFAIHDMGTTLFEYDVEADRLRLYESTELNPDIHLVNDHFSRKFKHVVSPDQYESLHRRFLQATREHGSGEVDFSANYRVGEYRWYRCHYITRPSITGGVERIIGMITQIDEVYKLRQRANFDAVTKVLSRGALWEAVEGCLSAGRLPATFLLFDLDDFKGVNDELGHAAGDKMLSAVGEGLLQSFRKTDIVGRLGGDEFVVFVPESGSEIMARRHASVIIEIVSKVRLRLGLSGEESASVGIAISEEPTTIDELYRRADGALYEAKRAGKASLAFAD